MKPFQSKQYTDSKAKLYEFSRACDPLRTQKEELAFFKTECELLRRRLEQFEHGSHNAKFLDREGGASPSL